MKTDKSLFSIFEKVSKEKMEKVLILFLIGVFCLVAATPVSKLSGNPAKTARKDEKTVMQDSDVTISENSNNNAYITQLENKLEQTIGGMQGAGDVSVMITLKDNGEKILDKNLPYENSTEKSKEEGKESERTSIKSNSETVLIEEAGDSVPIVVQEMYPSIEGVVVICEGGDDKVLALQIKEAIQALFSIDAHKIVVYKGSSKKR